MAIRNLDRIFEGFEIQELDFVFHGTAAPIASWKFKALHADCRLKVDHLSVARFQQDQELWRDGLEWLLLLGEPIGNHRQRPFTTSSEMWTTRIGVCPAQYFKSEKPFPDPLKQLRRSLGIEL